MAILSSSNVRETLRTLSKDVESYFDLAKNLLPIVEEPFHFSTHKPANHFWDQLTPELQETAESLINRLLEPCAILAEQITLSPLTGSEDQQQIKIGTKTMRAALKLRRYTYHEPDVIHDEGTILGFRPADQKEDYGLFPEEAEYVFFDQLSRLGAVLKLVEATILIKPEILANTAAESSKYLTGTAFIMMWMDSQYPELNDVADTVRTAFNSFGIRAQRADDIEHEGLITERILNEIRKSEFLFADLSGMRPNVYYEVGYAHALGKRVILFRKSNTKLHFDLAGYNCPEYENLRDLKEKLSKRLVSLTNRNPSNDMEI